MNVRRVAWIAAVIGLLATAPQAANAAVVRSWDSNNEDGGDLFSSGTTDFEYGTLRSELQATGHTVLPGVATLSPSVLTGVDVFFHGRSGGGVPAHILSASEATAIQGFMAAGGCVIVESNSEPQEQASANSMLGALGLGAPFNGAVGGSQTTTAGTFANVVTHTTVGPFGDLRGQSFGSSINSDITPGTGTVVGTNAGIRTLVEYQLSPNAYVLATGDPYGFGLFQSPTGSLFNANNQSMYLNFISQCGSAKAAAPAMSVPALVVLAGLIFLVGWVSLRRRPHVA